ncbi:MAG: LysM peptidoglycan-binding domain-containing protein, partial [Bacteroidales bacterium]|nr:LysM peptidoglycan-binding domain-containing protein [Bacteroidales bacterium]
MKKYYILALFLCFSATWIIAQMPPPPVAVQISDRIENVDGVFYHLHTVEKGQTLYSISRAYQVKPEDIKRTIDKPEIQVDEILLIPSKQKPSKIVIHKVDRSETKPQDTVAQPDTMPAQTYIEKPKKPVMNVALMLPLYLNEVDQINPRDKNNRAFSLLQFYEGAVFAIKEFESEETKINVQVFDVTGDERTAVNLINSGKLDDVDVMVGPLFLRSFRVMSDFAEQRRIFII